MMKKIWACALIATAVLAGCKGEKKINSYSDIYSERPTTVYIAPVIDKAVRKVEKYPSDIEYNNAINTAGAFLRQTMAQPMLNKGYYVLGPVASREIADTKQMSEKALRNGSLTEFGQEYGIDAMLVVTLHRWREENGKWIAYLEYQLRSTKSNVDLMHTWVVATKKVPTDLKGDPHVMHNDMNFAQKYGMDNETAQRCFLVEKVNDYVLRNLPTSSSRRQFEKDLYRTANPTYISYTWTEDGGADVEPCSVEEYEEKAFL